MRISGCGVLIAVACGSGAPSPPVSPVVVTPAHSTTQAAWRREAARDPAVEKRARLEAACFATPWQSSEPAHGPKPLSPRTRARLDVLERECRDIHPELGPGRFVTPLSIPAAECHYGIGRIYFEEAHYADAARWFLRVADEHADADVGIFGAQLYLTALDVLHTHAAPARPECRELMGGDAHRFACRWCEKPDSGDACEVFRRVAKQLVPSAGACARP